ncbi:serine hydrolase [Aureicoccus marinus]|nr:serine hydrolase domain-containing protein [Aureicoccus marinus]
MKSLQSLLIIFLGAITFISAQDKTLKERIDGLLKANIEESDAGLFIGVVQNGEIIYEGYRGLANLEHQVPVGPLTRSNIASTSKQFVALMLLEMSMKAGEFGGGCSQVLTVHLPQSQRNDQAPPLTQSHQWHPRYLRSPQYSK